MLIYNIVKMSLINASLLIYLTNNFLFNESHRPYSKPTSLT